MRIVYWNRGGIIFIASNEACVNGAIHSRHKYSLDSNFRLQLATKKLYVHNACFNGSGAFGVGRGRKGNSRFCFGCHLSMCVYTYVAFINELLERQRTHVNGLVAHLDPNRRATERHPGV